MSVLSEHSIFVSRELQVQQNWPCLQFYLSSVGHDLNLEIQPRQFAAGFGNFENDIIIKSGKGSKVWDEDNNEYIDYLIGSGPMLLGHGHPEVMEAIFEQLPKGMTFFAIN